MGGIAVALTQLAMSNTSQVGTSEVGMMLKPRALLG